MAAPNDYDPSWRVDDALGEWEEAPYMAIVGRPVSARVENAVMRYERRLGRRLTATEGQVLMHALTALDPQKKPPRFQRCKECGQWIDNGKFFARHLIEWGFCSDCSIPF